MKKRAIAFLLCLAMVLTMLPSVQAEAASDSLYLAYKYTETGRSVLELSKSGRTKYRVDELNMCQGNAVQLCWLNGTDYAKWTWKTSDQTIVTVDNDGNIEAKAPGTATVTLTYYKKKTNQEVSASIKVHVGEEYWPVELGTTSKDIPDKREMKVGRTIDLAFFGLANWYGGKLWQCTWMSSDETVATVDRMGVVETKAPGTAKIGLLLFNKVSQISIYDYVDIIVTEDAYTEPKEWDNPYYKAYGEDYLRLYSTDYMFKIPGAIVDKFVARDYGKIAETPSGGAYSTKYYDSLMSVGGFDRFLMGTLEFLSTGVDIATGAAWNGSAHYEEEKAYMCGVNFIDELRGNGGAFSAIMEEIYAACDELNTAYDTVSTLEKYRLIELLERTTNFSKEKIEEEVDKMLKQQGLDQGGDILSVGFTTAEFIITTFKLYELDEDIIRKLDESEYLNGLLGKTAGLIREKRSQEQVTTYFDQLTTAYTAGEIEKIINDGTAGIYTVVKIGAGLLQLVSGLSVDKYYSAVEYGSYQAELRFACMHLLEDINKNYDSYSREELMDKIEEYEFLYETYLVATRMMMEEAISISSGKTKSNLQSVLNEMNKNFSFTYAVDIAMKHYREDGNHSDEHEYVKPSEVMKAQAEYDKLFTILDEFVAGEKVKLTYKDDSTTIYRGSVWDDLGPGKQCYSFAQVVWYNLYGHITSKDLEDKDTNKYKLEDPTEHTEVIYQKAKPTKEEVKALKDVLERGDFIQVAYYKSSGAIGPHSMIVNAVTSSGIEVIEANWNRKNGVDKRTMSWESLYERTSVGISVYRADKVIELLEILKDGDVVDKPVDGTTGSTDGTKEKQYGVLDLSSKGWNSYNVGLDKNMYADKAYTLYSGAKLEILGEYYSAKGTKVYHVYSYDLKMECYITAKYVKIQGTEEEIPEISVSSTPSPTNKSKVTVTVTPSPTVTTKPKVTVSPTPKPTATSTPKPTPTNTPTPKPTVSPTPTNAPTPTLAPEEGKIMGTLDLSSKGWSSYNVGTNADMYADKAYTLKNGASFEILDEAVNSKGTKVYKVYSNDLKMECYVVAKFVDVDYSDVELYGVLDLSSKGWSSYNVGLDVDMNANKAYTVYNGSRFRLLGKSYNAKGNEIYKVYSYDLKMDCYVAAKYVKETE